jgi:hypothetical protein
MGAAAAPAVEVTATVVTPTQTYGERAVGLSFNPSGFDLVNQAKIMYANMIDLLDDIRKDPAASSEKKRLASVAITEAQGAQMWAVKALTWKD